MSRLQIRKKMYSRKKPNPNLPLDAPCWCGSNAAYADCHKMWDMVRERRVDALICSSPGR